MKLRRRVLWTVAVVVAVVLAFFYSGWILPREYPTRQTVERVFSIDLDFTRVRQILVRTNAARQIITMAGESEFVDQKWDAAGGGLDSFNPLHLGWKLELHGTLRVRTLDPYIGQHVITLAQQVDIDTDQLRTDIELKQGSPRLREYEMRVWFERDKQDGTTIVRQSLTQEIVTEAPWFAHWIADRRVRASAKRAIDNQQRAIRELIEKNRDKRWLLFDQS